MNLLPKTQKLEIGAGFLKSKNLLIKNTCADTRMEKTADTFAWLEKFKNQWMLAN